MKGRGRRQGNGVDKCWKLGDGAGKKREKFVLVYESSRISARMDSGAN